MARPCRLLTKTLDEIARLCGTACPRYRAALDLHRRLTRARPEAEFDYLLRLAPLKPGSTGDVAAFATRRTSPAQRSKPNKLALPDHVPEEVKEERWPQTLHGDRAGDLGRKARREGGPDHRRRNRSTRSTRRAATCRTMAECPRRSTATSSSTRTSSDLAPGRTSSPYLVEEAGDYDLWGRLSDAGCAVSGLSRGSALFLQSL